MHQKVDTQTKNMNKTRFVIIFTILLCFFSIQAFAEYYGRDIPDSSEIRKSLVERWFTSDLKYLRLEESQVYKTSAGEVFQVRLEEFDDSIWEYAEMSITEQRKREIYENGLRLCKLVSLELGKESEVVEGLEWIKP